MSLFGAWGPCQTGWERLVRTFRWVGSRYSGGTAATSVVEVLGLGDELAYTVGYEGQVASVDGAPEGPMRLRVTHIYRRENGEWRLVHRHADLAPPDQSGPEQAQRGVRLGAFLLLPTSYQSRSSTW